MHGWILGSNLLPFIDRIAEIIQCRDDLTAIALYLLPAFKSLRHCPGEPSRGRICCNDGNVWPPGSLGDPTGPFLFVGMTQTGHSDRG